MLFTTKNGTEYIVSDSVAYPTRHPNPPRHGGFNPNLDWNEDTARAVGVLVDSSLDRDSYAVRTAGKEWLEVYDHLRESK